MRGESYVQCASQAARGNLWPVGLKPLAWISYADSLTKTLLITNYINSTLIASFYLKLSGEFIVCLYIIRFRFTVAIKANPPKKLLKL